ncbi:hypothetical protein RSOLAG1IB_05720 [Rhizoctonia solani AG-1 IB]|uniref:Uncharacterized protein n=1 Tax=Thanatephorus cucumeris (strain AG1-IB / isolate 7/3/14) TaxID=1108050 RepID=A0A0B7F378_THACB|nr:hypothetical protein RSOLAG1IB_05720 [Rhizoctonia solani AG-1 IB]
MCTTTFMGTNSPPFSSHASSLAAFFAFLAESNPSYEFLSSYHVDPAMQSEKCYRYCANPIMASQCSRYSSTRVGRGFPQEVTKVVGHGTPKNSKDPSAASSQVQDEHCPHQLQKADRYRFKMFIHPEGLPYFYQDKLVTCDNMDDPRIKECLVVAIALVCYMLRHMKDVQQNFTFHEEVELCVELTTTDYPPKFNYYIADHENQSIFWADAREPESIQGCEGIIRDNILREEYWKHIEYYPCHQEVSKTHFEELKNLMAACATDAATSEGSTSPMSAKDISAHILNLNEFGEHSKGERTWAIARIYGLFIRSQIINRYGTQDAKLDRFASLEANPPTFHGCYAWVNRYLAFNLGDKHIRRCARTWADRIAYTESWRAYKTHYLEEWKEIRRLSCIMMVVCSCIAHIHSLGGLLLQRVTILGMIFSSTLSYYLSNELINEGDHAANAVGYFQKKEDIKYGIQRLALINCAPQAIFCWSIVLMVILLLSGS